MFCPSESLLLWCDITKFLSSGNFFSQTFFPRLKIYNISQLGGHGKWYTCNLIFVQNAYIMIFVHNDRLRTVHDDIQTVKIKLIYCSVHINRVFHFIRDNFSRIQLYTYISFNGPHVQSDLCTKCVYNDIRA